MMSQKTAILWVVGLLVAGVIAIGIFADTSEDEATTDTTVVESTEVVEPTAEVVVIVVEVEPTAAPEPTEVPPTDVPEPTEVPAGPATTFGDGVHLVGVDIAPGTYRNDDSSGGCYWERLSGFGGEGIDDIIANEFTDAISIVTISPGDVGFSSSDCGIWTPLQ